MFVRTISVHVSLLILQIYNKNNLNKQIQLTIQTNSNFKGKIVSLNYICSIFFVYPTFYQHLF